MLTGVDMGKFAHSFLLISSCAVLLGGIDLT